MSLRANLRIVVSDGNEYRPTMLCLTAAHNTPYALSTWTVRQELPVSITRDLLLLVLSCLVCKADGYPYTVMILHSIVFQLYARLAIILMRILNSEYKSIPNRVFPHYHTSNIVCYRVQMPIIFPMFSWQTFGTRPPCEGHCKFQCIL